MSCFATHYLLDAIAPHLVESIVFNKYSINVFEIYNVKYVIFESQHTKKSKLYNEFLLSYKPLNIFVISDHEKVFIHPKFLVFGHVLYYIILHTSV